MRIRMRSVVFLCLAMTACGISGNVLCAEGYLVQPGDVLAVSVWKEADLSGDLLVRPDGGITMPLVGEISAAGKTVEDVRSAIDQRLRKYIPEPSVTVSVKQTQGNQIFV